MASGARAGKRRAPPERGLRVNIYVLVDNISKAVNELCGECEW